MSWTCLSYFVGYLTERFVCSVLSATVWFCNQTCNDLVPSFMLAIQGNFYLIWRYYTNVSQKPLSVPQIADYASFFVVYGSFQQLSAQCRQGCPAHYEPAWPASHRSTWNRPLYFQSSVPRPASDSCHCRTSQSSPGRGR